MKRGFEEILLQYPDARNLNGEAMFACAANDRATYQSVMKQLGNRLLPSIWQVDLKYCQAQFGAISAARIASVAVESIAE